MNLFQNKTNCEDNAIFDLQVVDVSHAHCTSGLPNNMQIGSTNKTNKTSATEHSIFYIYSL